MAEGAIKGFARDLLERIEQIEYEHAGAVVERDAARLALSQIHAQGPEADPDELEAAEARVTQAESAFQSDPGAPHVDTVIAALVDVLKKAAE